MGAAPATVQRDPIADAVLLPYQQRWIEDTSPVKIIEKSRRIGLSYAEAADSVLYASAESGANVYYISYDKEMTAGFIQDCATWARAFHAGAAEIQESVIEEGDKQILTYAIKFDSGHKIQTFSSNPRNLRSKGRPGERLVIDEAAFVDDIEGLLKAAMAMTMWGGSVHIMSTHNGEENPFNSLINDVRAKKYDYSLHRVTLDDALEDGLFKKICEVTDKPWSKEAEHEWRQSLINRSPDAKEELFCIPSQGGGTYMARALIEPNMKTVPILQFNGTKTFNMAPEPVRAAEIRDWIKDHLTPVLNQLDKQRRHSFGMDFARSGDMSIIAPLELGLTMDRRVPFLMEMHNVPYRQQEQIMLEIGNGLPRFSGAAIDSTGNGEYIGEAAHDEWGSMVDVVKFSENWYRENMPPYKARLEDRTIQIPKSDEVLEDHRAFRLVNGVPRLPKSKTDAKGQRHGDSAVAIALANSAADQELGDIDWTPAPDSGPGWNSDPEDTDMNIDPRGAW